MARLEGIYLKPRSLQELVAIAREAVANVTQALAAAGEGEGGGSGGGTQTVVLDLPCTFFALRTDRCVRMLRAAPVLLPYISLCASRAGSRRPASVSAEAWFCH